MGWRRQRACMRAAQHAAPVHGGSCHAAGARLCAHLCSAGATRGQWPAALVVDAPAQISAWLAGAPLEDAADTACAHAPSV
jgi:hypothetical protein